MHAITLARQLLVATLLGAATLAHAFDLQGHRGARGLAPENTLAAFDRALAEGVNTLELDIILSADGVPMIVHDPFLPPDMTRDAQGQWLPTPTPLIRTLTLAELQSYDLGRAREGSRTARDFPQQRPQDGERMPTLAQLFERVKALGGLVIKLNVTGTVGVPDRLVILPGGAVWLVELKRPGGRVRPTQAVMLGRLVELGANAALLSSKEEVDEWIRKVASES